tara:strand:- start:329 stop:535 length:207 start_codon:yes stop_codon:yes gene_type:complete
MDIPKDNQGALYMTYTEIRARILDKYDTTELIDMLDIDSEALVDAFWDVIEEKLGLFEDILREGHIDD